MASWKKVIVSGSIAELQKVIVDGDVSASVLSGSFFGDGSGLTGVAGSFPSTPLLGTSHDATKFFVSDGASKFLSGSQLAAYTFGKTSGDVVISSTGTATIQANSVALGTDTTGNYVATITAGDGINTTGAASGETISHTISVDSGSILPYISSSVFSTVSGDITITDGGVATIQANSVALGTDTTGDYVQSLTAGALIDLQNNSGEGATPTIDVDLTEAPEAAIANGDYILFLDGGATGAESKEAIADVATLFAGTGLTATNSVIAVDYGTSAGTAAQGNVSLTFSGTANEIELSTNTVSTVGGGGTVTIGLPNDVTIGNNLTVSGDLIVQGTTTELQVTNLNVEDQYILLNSGSTTGDTGIIFGGANGAANTGTALIWDFSYNGNDGRLGIVNTLAADATGTQTPNYVIAGVFEGTEANAATAQADHAGNIRIEGEDIFIYS